MKTIAIGLSPNIEHDDVQLALKELVMPWRYAKGKSVGALEKWFRDYFTTSYATSFVNARSAMYAILSALGIGKGDEVLVQAFTCVVVATPIIATGATPIYVDVTKALTIDPKDLEKKITSKTKAIIVQHTFGIPAPMDEIMAIAKKHNVYIIEDVAHTIGADYKGKKLGTFGIASFFSFGRDKAFSSVFGGMAITSDQKLGEALQLYQQQKSYPSAGWIMQQLLHPIASSFVLPLYDVGSVGKLLLIILQKLHLLSFPVASFEKQGKFYPGHIKKMPNALATLALLQLTKRARYNEKRKEIGKAYQAMCKKLSIEAAVTTDEIFLRFPIFISNPVAMRKYVRYKEHIYLGNWYANVIDPVNSNFEKIGYTMGLCPNAEKYAKQVVNLPTLPTMTNNDVDRVERILQTYGKY